MRMSGLLIFSLSLVACGSAPAAPAAKAKRATAVFAGGCFWCTESDFDKVPGVLETTSGYSGGKLERPSYKQVSAGGTGHIEAVRVTYDPSKVSYAQLVQRFLPTVDVLDGGGQFCDRGAHYRSAIFVANAGERAAATAALRAAGARLKKPVATTVLPAATFWPAEDYHQDYYKKNPVRYKYYRWNCGRDQRLAALWRR
jgi:peptide-methionine (S)-S-oxide reductase